MKKQNLKHLFLLVLCAITLNVYAQTRPTHEQYVKIGSTKAWYTAYNNWQPGTALYNGDSEAAENEQFFISRVKPRKRFTFTGTQVKENLNPDRKLMWWCPLGEGNNGNWNGIPSYWFGGEVYSMWSYTDIYGNWTAPLIQAPASFLDACHKNGVRSGVVAAVPSGAKPTPNDGGHGSNISALYDGGYEKLLKYLRYYGVDGVGFNSEFSWSSLNMNSFRNLMGDCYANAEAYGVPFNNAWLSFTSNAGGTGDYSVLNSSCDEWFHYNGKTVSDAYFLNFNWGSSQLSTSQYTAEGKGRSGYDVYAGMDYQGRSTASWIALKSYNISFGLWGAHNMNMFYEGRGELGATAKQMQKTYQLICENSVTGSSYNPVNTPEVKNILRHTSTATDFHGFSSFITARSTMMAQYGDGTLADDPFVTYFNLGNGMFFKDGGVTTFDKEWYNLGVQDYLPTWRWWWTKSFMGKNASDASTDMVAEFTWDDAWFGGSCLQISGATTSAYLQLFKTKYAVKNNDKIVVRYKVLSGSGSISLTVSTEASPTTEVNASIASNASVTDEWVAKEIGIKSRGGLKLDGQTIALMGLKFENTSSNFKVLIGEISLTRGTSATPGTPAVTMSKTMARNYKGVDMKVVFDMTSNFTGTRQNYESIYNSDVKTSLYKVYTQQEGCDAVLCTATTSWAAYVVGAPYDEAIGGKIRIGVSAVSMDGKSESSIAWGSYNSVPAGQIIEGFSIDKPIIKANEEFTVAFDDPNHAAATWVIKASANDAVKGTFNAKSFTTSLSEEGIYDLYLTMNGTTEVYRGKIQISPAAVGAMPRIESLKVNGQVVEEGNNIAVSQNQDITFTYTGRQDADGYVSRGMSLQEKAFGIPADQLSFNDQTPFSMTFWIYFNQFNHESDGTQFLNIRSAADGWPKSDWGYLWSTINPAEGRKDNDGNVYKEGNLIFHYRLSADNTGEPIQTSTAFQFKPETWYHVALCMGYSNNRTLSLYINGQLIGEGTASQSLYSWKSSNVIMIGGRAFNRAGIDGTLDEVRLYNKALSADEVKASMEHTDAPSSVNGLIGYWDFESEADENNNVVSPFQYNSKNLIADLYDPSKIENTEYIRNEITYTAGAPFFSGTNYKIETLPTWKFKGGSIVSSTGDKASGSAKVAYAAAGTYPVTLTLANGWGSDTKTFNIDVTDEEIIKYNVSAVSVDEKMGSVEASATEVEEGSTVTLTATPAQGYEFVNWSVNGEVVSTENPYTATVTANTEFVANFEALTPAIIVTNDTTGVERQFTFDAFVEGAKVQIDWGNGELEEYDIAFYDSWTTWSTTIRGTVLGEGVVKIYGDQIRTFDCSYVASYPVKVTSLDLTGCPNLYELECYSNQLTALDLSANTALVKLTANKSAFAEGIDLSANTALTTIDFNDAGLPSIDLSANSALLSVKLNNNALGSLDVSALTELRTLYANNTGLTTIDLSANTVLKNLYVNENQLTTLDVSNMVEGSYTYANDNQLTELITAPAMLTSKTRINIKNNNFTLATLPVITGINAYNYAPQNAMAIATEITEGEELDLSSQAMVGENATVYAWYTTDGEEFTGYTVEGGKFVFYVEADTELYCTMTNASFANFSGANVFKTTNIIVKYVEGVDFPVYTISVATADEAMGFAEASATEVEEGSTVTLTATPNPGYAFVNWTVNGEVVSTENPYTTTISENTEFVANFVASYTATALTNNEEWGSVNINGEEGVSVKSIVANGSVTFNAVPAEGYEFVSWSLVMSGMEFPLGVTEPTYTIPQLTADMTIKATFKLIPVPVTGINLSQTEASLRIGKELQLSATILPNNATDKNIVWSSQNGGIATVDQTGKITAISAGTTTITVSAQDGSGVVSECEVTILPVLKGDSNDNDVVTVTDAVTTTNYIVGKDVLVFNYDAADVTSDGNITISDVSGTVTIVLEQPIEQISQYGRLMKNNIVQDYLLAEDFELTTDGIAQVDIAIDNTINYTALQADITAGEGITIEKIALGDRADATHKLQTSQLSTETTRVVIYSPVNKAFKNSGTSLMQLNIKGSSSATGDISINNIYASDALAQEYMLLAIGGVNLTPTSLNQAEMTQAIYSVAGGVIIKGFETSDVTIYTMTGLPIKSEKITSNQQYISLPEGMYIVNIANKVEKVIVRK